MGQSFRDSKRYASLYASPKGPGDARPTALQIVKDNDMIGKLSGKTVLLTGGSNGLGVDEVKNLARTGAKVYFTSRDLAKGERVRDELLQDLKAEGLIQQPPEIDVIQMELTSLDSIRAAAEEFKSKSDTLNILVNNAGVSSTPHKIIDGHEQQFLICHLAHFYLFQLLKPILLKSSTPSFNSRVVVLSSLAHTLAPMQTDDYNFEKRGYDPIVAYAQAKTANIWFANELERRYGNQGLHAISLHPGGIRTGLLDSHDPQIRPWMEKMMEEPYIKVQLMNVEQGSATAVLAAIGKEYEGVGGFYMENCGVSEPISDDASMGSPGYKSWAYDPENEKKLWLDSLEMVGLKDD